MKRQMLGYALSIVALLLLWQLLSWIVHLALPLRQARILPYPVEAMQVFGGNWQVIAKLLLGT